MGGKFWGAVILGVLGFVVLINLGLWQQRRLVEKEGIIARIDARIVEAPVALPENPDPQADLYLPVRVEGTFTGAPLRVQSAMEGQGAGYRLIQGFETVAGTIMIDRGFIPQARTIPAAPEGPQSLTGNLHWPDETDSFTPDPSGDLYYARDVALMAEALQARPVLVVLRGAEGRGEGVLPMPVTSEGIPNDHREYSITWFSLAAVWLVMSGFLVYRMRKQARG